MKRIGIAYQILLIALGLGCRSAPAQSLEESLAGARTAYNAGSYEEAERYYLRVIELDPSHTESYHKLARIYLEKSPPDPKQARFYLHTARRAEPDNVAYMETEMLLLRFDIPDPMANSLTDSRRRDLAEKMLELDASNPMALEEMGLFYFQDFLSQKAFIEANFSVENRWRARLGRKANETLTNAIDHYKLAIAGRPRIQSIYQKLLRLYLTIEAYDEAALLSAGMRDMFPEKPEPWLYLGLTQLRLQNVELAESCFERALALMSPFQQGAYEDVRKFLPPDQDAAYRYRPREVRDRFWDERDPLYLTQQNERRLEHYARMTYADLFFGNIHAPGWVTERGEVVVRYGLPLWVREESTFKGRILEWDYGDIGFIFEDYTRNGQYTYYSPPASEASWDDYAIKSMEYFLNEPERYYYEAPNLTDLPFLVSVFRDSTDQARVVLPYGIPLEAYDATVDELELSMQSGAFLTQEGKVQYQIRKQIETLQTRHINRVEEGALWVGSHTLTVPADARYEVSVEFETTDGSAVGVERDSIIIPDYSTDRLLVSDALPAYLIEPVSDRQSDGVIQHNGFDIYPAPWGVFDVEQPIYLYFEVYNLRPDAERRMRYTVQAVLEAREEQRSLLEKLWDRIRGQPEATGVSVQFDLASRAADDAQYLVLDAAGQPPGTYDLTLLIQDPANGQQAKTERVLILE